MSDEALIAIVPGLLWFALALAVVALLWRRLVVIADVTAERIRAGAPFGVGSFNVGAAPPAVRSGRAREATAEGPEGGVKASADVVASLEDPSRQPREFTDRLYLVHASQVVVPRADGAPGVYRVRVWLEADEEGEFDRVRKVTYRLHPTFSGRRVISTEARKSNFELWLNVYGEFNIVALVERDPHPVEPDWPVLLTRYLDLPGRPPD